MIPRAYISEWRQYAPWPEDYQVEQDLIISKAIVDIFNHPELGRQLAFRGGTALFKMHLPASRYSEDIDLVQVNPGPIGNLLDCIKAQLNPWLGEPGRKQTEGRVTLNYRMISEDGLPLRLKVEINSREHFSVYGFETRPFEVRSRWFSGKVAVLTYQLEELLGTKLRALYQRKKGRDLFDLWTAFSNATVRKDRVIETFLRHMKHEGHRVSRAEFEMNLAGKFEDARFTEDIAPLLASASSWNFLEAADFVRRELIPLLPGAPWQGKKA
jgi:predicted nucleotidyltransferase component of viral defense system